MIDKNKAVWEQVAECVAEYTYGVGRAQIARDFGVTVSTAKTHLEKAVSYGLLAKSYTWVGGTNNRGWVYTSVGKDLAFGDEA